MNNTKITAALCMLRDIFKEQAKEELAPAEAKLEAAKQEYHKAKIRYNQLIRQSDNVQSLITVSMQSELNAEKQLEEEYKYHPTLTYHGDLNER